MPDIHAAHFLISADQLCQLLGVRKDTFISKVMWIESESNYLHLMCESPEPFEGAVVVPAGTYIEMTQVHLETSDDYDGIIVRTPSTAVDITHA